jgi:hypothetical protein
VVGSRFWKVSHLTKNIKNKFYKISYTVEIVTKTHYLPPTTYPSYLFSVTKFVPHTTRAKRAKGTTRVISLPRVAILLVRFASDSEPSREPKKPPAVRLYPPVQCTSYVPRDVLSSRASVASTLPRVSVLMVL